MINFDRKAHWENIYETRQLEKVGWYQETPETSLYFIHQLDIPLNASIIDVGGGDSYLVDHLLDLGYTDITVLDISITAIDRAKKRLADRAHQVEWIVSDIIEFKPAKKYEFWHDRASFHFFVDKKDIKKYIENINSLLIPGGHLVIGTFSESGPTTCSGVEIQQYSENTISDLFSELFKKIECKEVEHTTPSKNIQNYLFCNFSKMS